MVRKLTLVLLILGAVAAAVAGTVVALSVPLLRRLPQPGRTTVDGITTLADAVEACRRSQLRGWDLVTYAQQLVASKFSYSRLNPWDTPSRAFERGLGYCEQQTLALKYIFDRLGIASRPVFALRCRFPAKVVDGAMWPGGVSAHTWQRVRIGNDERDVCTGSVLNTPGVTQFEILSPVNTWYRWQRPFTRLGSVIENIRRDRAARRTLQTRASNRL